MASEDVQTIEQIRAGIAMLGAEITDQASAAFPPDLVERTSHVEHLIVVADEVRALALACAVLIGRPGLV